MKYVLVHPQWGFLVIPRYPSMWLADQTKAHRFATRRKALKARARWDRAVQIEIRSV